jgi:alpha-tubulin suppressor-like RCC1 family protein
MAVGNAHSCALLADGRVDCWGSNDFGQLGTGNWTSTPSPMAVPELDGGVRQICWSLRHV